MSENGKNQRERGRTMGFSAPVSLDKGGITAGARTTPAEQGGVP